MKKEDSDLKGLIQILRELDKPSLALIDSGARLLKARMEMDSNKPQKTAQEERMLVLVCIGCSVVVSVITTKLLAIHYFGIVNGYVDEICNKTKEFVQKMESTICKR